MTTLLVFLAVGASLWWVLATIIRERTESTAEEHAEFVAHSVIRPALSGVDLHGGSWRPGDRPYEDLRTLIVADVVQVQFPVIGVTIRDRGGAVLFSDDPGRLGTHTTSPRALESAFAGEVVSIEPNQGPGQMAGSPNEAVLATFVPVALPGPSGSPSIVIEIDTDVAAAAIPVGRPFRLVGLALAGGLTAIYVVQLPLVRRLGHTLRAQNQRLGELLLKEQGTVEELRELNRRQAEFLAVTSHELRTPLTSIEGYAKTLLQPAFADDRNAREEFVRTIERQAGRLGTMIENILAVTQLNGSGGDAGEASPGEAIRSVSARRPEAAHQIVVDIPPDLPLVRVEPHLLELVLGNLIDNALKFSPAGSTCRVGACEEVGHVTISVQDDGVGIADEHAAQIFDRFYQIDSSSTRRHGGIGLGLHLVKTIVDRAGGTVGVESQLGRGTRFMVRLPAVPVEPTRQLASEPTAVRQPTG